MLRQRDYPLPRLLRLLDGLEKSSAPGALTLGVPPSQLFSEALDVDTTAAEELRAAARSSTGAFVFFSPGYALVARPPFPVAEPFRAAGYQTAPLRRLLTKEYRVAAVLLRLGGYAVGVYEGQRLLVARNDARFVKNRHRKGGQSQRRLDRIREKQVHELFGDLCETARERLAPFHGQLDWLVFGGDRHTVQSFLKECAYLRDSPTPVLPRFLTVPDPRHETLVSAPTLLYTSTVFVADSPEATG
jgi:hypothetical protein